MEKIKTIENIDKDGQSGFAVTTNRQIIELTIDNYQSCCECWGYFMSNDNPEDFIGARLRDIQISDTCLNQAKLDDTQHIYEGGVMFVNIITDRGVLQFTAYNEHNGYYGHMARVKSTQLEHQVCL